MKNVAFYSFSEICIKNELMDRSQKWDIIGNYYRTPLKVL